MMKVNRNQFFLAGILLLFLGLQFRYIEAFTLNEKCSQLIAKGLKKPAVASTQPFPAFLMPRSVPPSRRTVRPPKWLGFAMMSVGAVLFLHALAMRKPE